MKSSHIPVGVAIEHQRRMVSEVGHPDLVVGGIDRDAHRPGDPCLAARYGADRRGVTVRGPGEYQHGIVAVVGDRKFIVFDVLGQAHGEVELGSFALHDAQRLRVTLRIAGKNCDRGRQDRSRFRIGGARGNASSAYVFDEAPEITMIGDADLNIDREGNSTPWLQSVVYEAASRLGYQSHFFGRTLPMDDDHLPFVKRGVPSVDLIDFNYGYNNVFWHSPQDTIDKLSPQSLKIIGQTTLESLRILDKMDPLPPK